jgi:hypothetical protein
VVQLLIVGFVPALIGGLYGDDSDMVSKKRYSGKVTNPHTEVTTRFFLPLCSTQRWVSLSKLQQPSYALTTERLLSMSLVFT